MTTATRAQAAGLDPVVIAQARAGDQAAFAAIYAAYYPRIVSYCRRIVRDATLAEDLAQDTLIKAYHALPRTTPDLRLPAWLFRIATNTALSALRTRRRVIWLPLLDWHPARDGSDSPAAVDDRAILRAALRQVPPRQAALLVLHLHHGLSYDELAARCGSTPAAVKMRCSRARATIRGMRNEG